jgi:hypothetical protein
MTQMILREPLVITSRLVPGIRVWGDSDADDAYIEVEPISQEPNGRTIWRYTVRLKGARYTADDLTTGPRSVPLGEVAREALSIVLEDLANEERTIDQMAERYNRKVAVWADHYRYDIWSIAEELKPCCGEPMCLTCGASPWEHTDTAHEYSHVCERAL